MSKNSNVNSLSHYPRAPPLNEFDDHVFMQAPPPPTYEQSVQQQQQQCFQNPPQPSMYAQHYPVPVYNYPPAYATPPMSAPTFGVPMAGQMYRPTQNPPVLQLARGAEVRKTANGAISIPPPPPGILPSPAQLAAMQGQSVLVKESKKRSFFSL